MVERACFYQNEISGDGICHRFEKRKNLVYTVTGDLPTRSRLSLHRIIIKFQIRVSVYTWFPKVTPWPIMPSPRSWSVGRGAPDFVLQETLRKNVIFYFSIRYSPSTDWIETFCTASGPAAWIHLHEGIPHSPVYNIQRPINNSLRIWL